MAVKTKTELKNEWSYTDPKEQNDNLVDSMATLLLESGEVVDINGIADALVLDADGDTTISAPTDDQIDIEIAGADDFTFTANDFTALSGSAISTNTINETTAGSGVTVDGVVLKDTTVDVNGTADAVILDTDGDTTISAPTDDQLDIEVNGTDILVLSNDTGGNHAYMVPGATTHSVNRNVVVVFDDFLYQTITAADTPWIVTSGIDAQAADPAINTQAGGVIRLTTGDADGAVANDGSQIICSVPMTANAGGLVFETRLHINTAVTTVSVWAGFTDVNTLEEPATIGGSDAITGVADDCVVFAYDTGADTDEWFAIGFDSTTEATGAGATGTAPTADTYQTLRIEVDSDGASARFYIDGTLAGTTTANTVTPGTTLYATVGANATTTTQRTVDIDYIYVGHSR